MVCFWLLPLMFKCTSIWILVTRLDLFKEAVEHSLWGAGYYYDWLDIILKAGFYFKVKILCLAWIWCPNSCAPSHSPIMWLPDLRIHSASPCRSPHPLTKIFWPPDHDHPTARPRVGPRDSRDCTAPVLNNHMIYRGVRDNCKSLMPL